MSGSVPTLSCVLPLLDVVAVPGNVTGTLTEQVLPFALTVTLTMVLPSLA